MAKKGFEILKPQHDEYVDNFTALTNGMNQGDQPREIVMKQVDHLLDKHALDYPEILLGYLFTRLEVEVMEALT
jgi:hypothetical protein